MKVMMAIIINSLFAAFWLYAKKNPAGFRGGVEGQ